MSAFWAEEERLYSVVLMWVDIFPFPASLSKLTWWSGLREKHGFLIFNSVTMVAKHSLGLLYKLITSVRLVSHLENVRFCFLFIKRTICINADFQNKIF